MLVKSKSVNGVQKRKEERDDSVLIGEEIQLGFRVFFWFRVLFVFLSFAFSKSVNGVQKGKERDS